NGIAITTGAGDDVIFAGAGADTLIGNAGNDSFRFASANFTVADTVAGGSGTDEIRFTNAATVTDAAFANVSSVENVVLGDFAGQSVTLGTNSDAAGVVLVNASALSGTNAVTVDVSGRANAITVTG